MSESTDVTDRESLYCSAASAFLFLLVGGLLLGAGLGMAWVGEGHDATWSASLLVGGLIVLYSTIEYWRTVGNISAERARQTI